MKHLANIAIALLACAGTVAPAPVAAAEHPCDGRWAVLLAYPDTQVIDPDGSDIEAVFHGEVDRSAASVWVKRTEN